MCSLRALIYLLRGRGKWRLGKGRKKREQFRDWDCDKIEAAKKEGRDMDMARWQHGDTKRSRACNDGEFEIVDLFKHLLHKFELTLLQSITNKQLIQTVNHLSFSFSILLIWLIDLNFQFSICLKNCYWCWIFFL